MRGFSIVEFVVVILLLGVLSATAIARFVEPAAFAPEIVAQSVSSQARFALQSAQARRTQNIDLRVNRLTDEWQATVRVDGVAFRSAEADVGDTRVFVASGAVNGELDGANGLALTYDSSGFVSAASWGATALDPTLGIELSIQGSSDRTLCIFPTGVVSERAC